MVFVFLFTSFFVGFSQFLNSFGLINYFYYLIFSSVVGFLSALLVSDITPEIINHSNIVIYYKYYLYHFLANTRNLEHFNSFLPFVLLCSWILAQRDRTPRLFVQEELHLCWHGLSGLRRQKS